MANLSSLLGPRRNRLDISVRFPRRPRGKQRAGTLVVLVGVISATFGEQTRRRYYRPARHAHQEGKVKTGHLLKKVLPLTVALVVALVMVGVFIAGCGDATDTREGTQSAGADGSFLNTIIVSGTGKVTTLPDEASIQVSVENDAATAAEALDANSKDTQKVLDRLKAEGIADKAIETANVVVYPNRYYDQQSGQEKTTGYRAQNTVTVTFDDLSVIGDVFAAVIEAGADNVYR